jgi:hypothetical protein
VIGRLAAHRDLDDLEDGAIEALARLDLLDDEVHVVEQASAVEFHDRRIRARPPHRDRCLLRKIATAVSSDRPESGNQVVRSDFSLFSSSSH